MSRRLERVASLIKEELSLIFLHKIQDPELGIVTITKVKLTPDAKIAKVYVSILETEKRDYLMEKIQELNSFIRGELAKRVKNLRFIPELHFYIDDTQDYVEKIENLFKQIHKDDNKEE